MAVDVASFHRDIETAFRMAVDWASSQIWDADDGSYTRTSVGTLILPAGTIPLTSDIVLPSRIRLVGQGQYETKVLISDGATMYGAQETWPSNLHMGCEITNLSIAGPRNSEDRLLVFRGGGKIHLQNVFFMNGQHQLVFDGSLLAWVTQCTFWQGNESEVDGGRTAIWVPKSADRVFGSDAQGVASADIGNVIHIDGCDFQRGGVAIRMGGGLSHSVRGCHFGAAHTSMALYDGRSVNSTWEDNYAEFPDHTHTGNVFEVSGFCGNLTLRRNHITLGKTRDLIGGAGACEGFVCEDNQVLSTGSRPLMSVPQFNQFSSYRPGAYTTRPAFADTMVEDRIYTNFFGREIIGSRREIVEIRPGFRGRRTELFPINLSVGERNTKEIGSPAAGELWRVKARIVWARSDGAFGGEENIADCEVALSTVRNSSPSFILPSPVGTEIVACFVNNSDALELQIENTGPYTIHTTAEVEILTTTSATDT